VEVDLRPDQVHADNLLEPIWRQRLAHLEPLLRRLLLAPIREDRSRARDRGGERAEGWAIRGYPGLPHPRRHLKRVVPAAQKEGGEEPSLPRRVDDPSRQIELPCLLRVAVRLAVVPGLEQALDHHVERVASLDVEGVRAWRFLEQGKPLTRVIRRRAVPVLLPVARGNRVERALEQGDVSGPSRQLQSGARRLVHLCEATAARVLPRDHA